MPGLWRIELLGGLRATRGAHVVTRFETRKAASLLAYLTLYPQRLHSREALAELLWPDEDPEATRNRFKQVLSLLRKELEAGEEAGSVLETDRTHIRVQPGALTSDVAEFEAALDRARGTEGRARIEALEAAARLYQGELLPGSYEEWILAERHRLAERYLDGLDSLARALAEAGDFNQALDYARKAVTVDPLREASHVTVMRLYAAAGRVPDALRQFAELERTLREHLDATPSASVRALAEQIRSQEPEPPPAPALTLGNATTRSATSEGAPQPAVQAAPTLRPAPQIPAPLTRFFGRTEDLNRLGRLLTPHTARLITLMGPAGAGKSRLSVEAARQAQEAFSGNVWFVPLAAKPDAGAMLDAVVEALELPATEDVEPLEQVIAYLNAVGQGKEPLLVVFDNFEHLLNTAVEQDSPTLLLRRLLERVSGLTFLVSSRQRLEVEGERVFPVLPLSTPSEGEAPAMERLRALSSVQLFCDRAQAVEPFFELTAENAGAISELCRRLEGIPLAVELAAAWAAELTPAQMVDRLGQRFELLVSRRRDQDDRHQSLGAALESSYQQLPPAGQRFYAGLSAFRGGFSLEGAEGVALEWVRSRHPGVDLSALSMLSGLRGRSMLAADAGPDRIRYRLLETLREHAGAQLSQAERRELHHLHAQYYLALAEISKIELDGPNQATWLAILEAEADNFRGALEWSREAGEMELLAQLAGAMVEFWERRGLLNEGRRWLDLALSRPNLEPPLRALLLRGAGALAIYQRDLPRARVWLEEALRLDEAAKDEPGIAGTLMRLVGVALYQERPDEAEGLCSRALDLYDSLSDQAKKAWALRALGEIKAVQGDLAGAMPLFEQSLDLCRQLGELRGLAGALTYIGGASRAMGDFERARTATEEALRLHRQLGDKWASASSLDCLAIVAAADGAWERAHELTTESIRLHGELGNPTGVTWVFNELARSIAELGRMQRATLLWGAAIAADTIRPAETERRILADPNVDITRSMLGTEVFNRSLAQGKELSPDRAINVVFLGDPI